MLTKSEIPFGIDLGTTNSCGAVWWKEQTEVVRNDLGTRTTPSYYYFDGVESFVGKTAKDKRGTNPKNVYYDAKRLLSKKMNEPIIKMFETQWSFSLKGNRKNENFSEYVVNETTESLSPLSVSAAILQYMKTSAEKYVKTAIKKKFDPEINQVVIAIPVYFSTDEIFATYKAAKLANLNVISFITDPMATAISYMLKYGPRLTPYVNLFILDLGGGGYSVAIIKTDRKNFETLAVGGNAKVGARDFDFLIYEWMKQKLLEEGFDVENLNQKKRFQILVQAQAVREALRTSRETPVILGDIFESAKSFMFKRNEFKEMSKDLLRNIEDECRNALEKINFSPNDINHVLIVGGSRMPMVEKMLKNVFLDETKFSKAVNPDEVVAAGASIYAATLMKASKRPEILEINIDGVLSMNIGVEIAGGKFKHVLQVNKKVPCENNFELTNSEDNQ